MDEPVSRISRTADDQVFLAEELRVTKDLLHHLLRLLPAGVQGVGDEGDTHPQHLAGKVLTL